MATPLLSPSRAFVAMSACLTLLLAGCAFSGGSSAVSTGIGGSGGNSGHVQLAGKVHGGFQPIYNATVTLYAMNTGTSLYGDTPTAYASTTTGLDGSFGFTRGVDGAANSGANYSCPSAANTAAPGTAGDPEMYLLASGGDTTGSGSTSINNAAAKMVLAIGDCNSLSASTQVTLNEMSTVATLAAMQQFFNPATEALGAASSNITGLVNAVKMISNLDIIGNGIAQQSISPPSSVPGVTITGVPEYQKLNTIANILAACVSSNPAVSPTNCGVLATNAVPPAHTSATNFSTVTFPTSATDTLLAADYMFLNPTESQDYATGSGKLFNLFNLPTTSTSPYGTAANGMALATQPMDWTIGINYTTNGLCTNVPVTLKPSTVSTSTFATPLLEEYGMAIDASGNVWMGGEGGGSANPTGFDVLFEVSPQGAPLKCMTSVTGGVTGNTGGRRLAFDSQGNTWWSTNQGLVEYVNDTTNTAVGTFLTWPKPTGIALTSGLAADQQGNVYASSDASAGYIYKYPNVATANATANSNFSASNILPLGDTQLPAAAGAFRNIALTQGGYMATSGSTGTTNIYLFTPSTNVAAVNGYQDIKLSVTGDSTSYGLAESSDGSFVGGNTISANTTTAARVYKFNGITGASISASTGFTGGINGIRNVSLDGADNVWLGASGTPIDSTGTLGAIGEVDKNYNAISPKGVAITSCASTNTGCQTQGGFEKSFLPGGDAVWALAIDGSGNVWGAPNFDTNPSGTGVIGGTYFTIVGQAVPLVTPIVNNIH